MEVVRGLDQAAGRFARPVVTVGNFDGVHRGHQVILDWLRRDADQRDTIAVALTFDPHPTSVVRPEAAPTLLMSLEDRLDALAAYGLDACVVQSFTPEFAEVEADVFVERFLVGALATQKLVVGHDLNFGKDRQGSVESLVESGGRHGFSVEIVEPVVVDDMVVHSSVVREKVAGGQVGAAARLLGRPHRVRGCVVEGAGRGTELGFATANIATTTPAVPGHGVYATRTTVGGSEIDSATSIGTTPTFDGDRTAVEVHLFEDCGDIYGQDIAVDFVEHLRAQKKFDGPAALAAQIEADVARAKELLAGGR